MIHRDSPSMPLFDGRTFSRDLDAHRLGEQLERVRSLMSDGQWRTLRQIGQASGAPEQSVSARLRDLRKPRFGGLIVERRRVDGLEEKGVHEYRVRNA